MSLIHPHNPINLPCYIYENHVVRIELDPDCILIHYLLYVGTSLLGSSGN
ncbi:1802_t:CDS:1, partial [Ambispora gerdemannii]